MKRFTGVLVGIFVICLIGFVIYTIGLGIHEYKARNPIPQKSEAVQKTVTVTISIPVNLITADGVPEADGVPGAIETFGTSEDLPCFDPHSQGCRVIRSAQVVGGNLNYTLTVPVDTPLDIGYLRGGQKRADNIRVEGKLLNTFAAMGYSSSRGRYAARKWPVACFIASQDKSRKVTINDDPECTAQVTLIKLTITN